MRTSIDEIEKSLPGEKKQTTIPYGQDRHRKKILEISRFDKSKTSKSRLAQTLEEKNYFLNCIIEQSPFATGVSDTKGNILQFNPAFEKILEKIDPKTTNNYNFLKDPLITKNWLFPLVNSVYTESKTIHFTLNIEDSSLLETNPLKTLPISLKVTMFPILNKQKELTNVIINWIDITKQKRAEQALQKSAHEYKSTVDWLLTGVVVHHPDSSIILGNPKAAEILGISIKQMLGKEAIDPTWKFIYEDLSPMAPDDYPVNKVISSKEPLVNYVLGINNPNKPEITWVIVNATPLFSTNNKDELKKIVINFIDITKIKQAERALIQNKSLEAIKKLANCVTHDANNALMGIMGHLELALKEEEIPPKILKRLETIKKLGLDACHSIGRFKNSVQEEIQPLESETVIINKTIKDAIQQTKILWENAQIQVKTKLVEDFKTVGRPCDLRNVLFNLIKNCFQAMPQGGVIEITTRENEDYVYITITDNGIGMSEEVQKNIFNPFFTTKAANSGLGKGEGLGMNSAQTIIREHQGEIYVVNSAINKGTSIEIKLPSAKAQEKKLNESNVEKLEPITVLLVDDDEGIRNFGQDVFPVIGHKIDVATNGQEALALLKFKQYNLLLTDLNMEGNKDWLELIEQVTNQYPQIHIALMTGDITKGSLTVEEQKRRWIEYLLQKPNTIQDFEKLAKDVATDKTNN